MRYVVEGLIYTKVVELKELLKAENIESGITAGGLAVYTNRINKLKEIVNNFEGASIVTGKSYSELMSEEKFNI